MSNYGSLSGYPPLVWIPNHLHGFGFRYHEQMSRGAVAALIRRRRAASSAEAEGEGEASPERRALPALPLSAAELRLGFGETRKTHFFPPPPPRPFVLFGIRLKACIMILVFPL